MNKGSCNLIRIASVAALSLLIPLFGCGGNSGSGTQPSSPTITSVSVSCTPSSILITQTATCTSIVAGTGNYISSVNWSVSPSNIGTISSAGVFTPAAAGTATITAASTQDTTKSGNTSISAANTTALAISIVDLPAGTPGAVTVTDPNGQKTQVTGSEIITAMPGSYTVAAASVTIDSSAYIAKQQVQTVQVASGSPTAVTVDYYNVIPQTTKVLDSAGMQGIQISSDGTTLTISAASTVAQSLHSGDVLVVPPTGASTTAPMGLLRKVTGVNTGSSVIVVTVAAATLADAFQRLAIQV
jgi:Bacterial Ig-like domain (group 2)